MENKTREQVKAEFDAAGKGLESKTLQQVAGIVAALRDKLNDCEAQIHKVGDVAADPKLNPHGKSRMDVELLLAVNLMDVLAGCRDLLRDVVPAVALTGMGESGKQAFKK